MSTLEAAWQWVGMASVLAIVPVIPMSMLTFGSSNFLDTLAGAVRQFFRMEKMPSGYASSKKPAFKIPTWMLVLMFVAVMITTWVGTSLIHANNGSYNGWVTDLNQITLVLIFASFAIGNSWWSAYFVSNETCIPGVVLPIVISIIAGVSAEIKYSQFNVGQSFLLLPWNAYMTFLGIWAFFQERKCKSATKKNAFSKMGN